MNFKQEKIFYLFLAAISLLAIFGAAVYLFYALNWPGIAITLFLTGGGLWFFGRMLFCQNADSSGAGDTPKNFFAAKNKISWKKIGVISAWLLPYFLLLAYCSLLLFKARTDAALTSPWQAVPAKFFIAYILAAGYLFWLILKNSRFTLYLIAAHYFLSFSVLWIIFKIGYGYDPFIHQASLELIDKQGFINPKKIFYLGYYSLILISHKLFFLPIIWLNKILVPVLAAIILPKIISDFLKNYFQISNFKFQILFLLILPFSAFTVSVPQNLAYLFFISALFAGLTEKNRLHLILTWLLCLACLAIHPLSGIPALFLALALSAWHLLPAKKQLWAYGGIFLILSLALPAALYLSQSPGAGIEAPAISKAGDLFHGFSRLGNPALNFINLFSYYQIFWLSILALTAIIFSFVWRKKNEFLPILAGLSLALFAAFFITKKTVAFSALINYERDDYLERILISAWLFLLPAIILIFIKLINRISEKNIFIKSAWLVFGLLLIASSLYCSYPRLDGFYNSRGFTMSKDDLEAVSWIEKNAAGEPYIVLANQQVSAAALKTFGFERYLKAPASREGGSLDEIYFYPIPTGGPLYQIYLDMVYKKADKKTALKAAELAGVKTAYFVLNKYWAGFDKIAEEAKLEASLFESIDNGKVLIFKYLK